MNDIYYQQRESDIYDLEYKWKTDDVDYWVALAKEYVGENGTALELGCGTGRILIPMAESGIRIVGVDQSPFMLARAKEKYDRLTGEAQSRIGLLEGDMRNLQLEQKFNLIYIPFNTFLVLRTTADQLAVFDTARRLLAPNGLFAFDIFVPDLLKTAEGLGPKIWKMEVDQTLGEAGIRFQRDIVREVDPIRQQLFITWRMKEYRDNVLLREWLSDMVMTYVFPRELEHLVARAGFEFVHFWGDFERHEFDKIKGPVKQLPVLRPK